MKSGKSKERGGKFLFSDRNTAHVEVDGRIVSGQNHLSSAAVAEKIIEILKRDSGNRGILQ